MPKQRDSLTPRARKVLQAAGDATALASLAEATGLNNIQLAALLDCDDQVLAYWLSGERKPRHPAMLRRALQLIVLEQKGVITDKLIENATK